MNACPASHGVGILFCGAVGDGKGNILCHFLRVCFVICADGNDFRIKLFQGFFFILEADQLPAAIGSPVAAIEQGDQIFGIHVIGNGHGATADQVQGNAWKAVPFV